MDDDFEKWLKQWDAAQIEIAAEQPQRPAEPQPRTSFFNNQPSEFDYEDNANDSHDDWLDMYQKSMEIPTSSEELLTDSVMQYQTGGAGLPVYGNPVPSTKPDTGTGKKVYLQNPIHFASAGKDQGDDCTDRVRVTDNWSDGEDLRELDDVKRRVEAMERRVHAADVFNKNSERAKLQTELTDLRIRVRKL